MEKYSADEVLQETLKYFDGNELAANVWITKYALKNKEGDFVEKSPQDMHNRIAKEFVRIEDKFGGDRKLSFDDILGYTDNFKYIVPQGSPMYGIGNDYNVVSLSNCVVVESPDDTMSSILDRGRDLANLYKRRAGVGIDISTLRPDGAFVNNAAGTSSGAWSFADFYSYITRMVGQSGRRGACMITMDIRHPDVDKFVTMKHDLSRVTGANISVKISDDFMRAVEEDGEFTLRYPCNGDNVKFSRTVRAKELWDLIVQSATKTAEPGILMWDNIIKYLPAHCYKEFETRCVNPCVTGDTVVMTEDGPRCVTDILNEPCVVIVNGKTYKSTGFIKTRVGADVYRLTLDNGMSVKLTHDHKVGVSVNGQLEWVEAGKLDKNSKVIIHNHGVLSWDGEGKFNEGYLLGYITGDGCVYSDEAIIDVWDDINNGQDGIINCVLDCVKDMIKRSDFVGFQKKNKNKQRLKLAAISSLAKKYDICSKKNIGNKIEESSSEFHKGFLRGFFDADGSVKCDFKKGSSVRLSQSNIDRLIVVQRMLLRLGINSKLYGNRRPEGFNMLPDGKGGMKECLCKASHELIISKDNIIRFHDAIGFSNSNKSNLLSEIIEYSDNSNRGLYSDKFVSLFKSLEYVGKEDVYDLTVDNIHAFDGNGIYLSNCAELPLSPYDSCRLISINLKHFVEDRFTESAKFDFKKLEKVVSAAMRMSDDLVELELEKLSKIISMSDEKSEIDLWTKLRNAANIGRRTGLGTHGLADAIACLRLKYDSDESIAVIDKIYETIKVCAYKESIELAKERGAFDVFDWELEKDNLYIQSLSEDIKAEIKEYGRRNISILTNAPTGSISLVSKTSSGIEAVFKNQHIRRKKINHNDKDLMVDYTDDMGDKWQEFDIFHPNVKEYLDMYNTTEIPDFFVESSTIDWQKRVVIQSVIQKHLDHSISSTINLPEDTPASVVGNIYIEGWKKGLKGITVYVDGSRSGVLVNKKEEAVGEFKYHDAVIRPDELICDINNVIVKGEKWTILVGLLDGKPYEVFGGLSEMIEIPRGYKEGELVKVCKTKHKRRYDLKFGEDGWIKDVTKVFNNPDYQVLTRMVSLALRHGTRPSFLIEQLQKDPDNNLTSFSRVLSRVIKKYIENGTNVTSSDKMCAVCENDTLVYQDGCILCTSCGWSKCM